MREDMRCHAVCVADAGMSVGQLLDRISGYSPQVRVVVRRKEALQIYWYIFMANHVSQLLKSTDSNESLSNALKLPERDPARTVQSTVIDEIEELPGEVVVLGGFDVLSVIEVVRQSVFRSLWTRSVFARPRRHRLTRRQRRSGGAMWSFFPRPVPAIYDTSAPALQATQDTVQIAQVAEVAQVVQVAQVSSLIRAPQVVEVGQQFDLDFRLVGALESLSTLAKRSVLSRVPESFPTTTKQSLSLEVHLFADGFEAPDGWYHVLPVEKEGIRIPLIPQESPEDIHFSSLLLSCSHRGRPCGILSRNIAVRKRGVTPSERTINGGKSWVEGAESRGLLEFTLADLYGGPDAAADLTVIIARLNGNDAYGDFQWSFMSPHWDAHRRIRGASKPMHLGSDAQTFAKSIIDAINEQQGNPLVDNVLRGVGAKIARCIPLEFWDHLREVWNSVHRKKGGIPTLFLLSAEPHIPWELAWLNEPLDETKPAFLGAQVNMGRWIYDQGARPLLPDWTVNVDDMTVVVGHYDRNSRLQQPPRAVSEGQTLTEKYGAKSLTVSRSDLKRLLDGDPEGVDAIHFACHGKFDITKPNSHIIYLDDGTPLNPLYFESAKVANSRKPFLFLNACQAGTGGEELGQYGGFAGSALRAGFRGFLGPFWSIPDDIAEHIALLFYERALDYGVPLGEILRELRANYGVAVKESPAAAYLAYIYYGHPVLRLFKRTKSESVLVGKPTSADAFGKIPFRPQSAPPQKSRGAGFPLRRYIDDLRRWIAVSRGRH